MLKNQVRWLWLALLVLSLDMMTKRLASAYLIPFVAHKIFPFLNMVLVHNHGAAFGLLHQDSGWQVWALAFVAMIVVIGLLIWLSRVPATSTRLAIAISLIIGGALGNLFDRLAFGYVVDFIDFHIKTYHWPAFNIADSAICIGVVLMMWSFLKGK